MNSSRKYTGIFVKSIFFVSGAVQSRRDSSKCSADTQQPYQPHNMFIAMCKSVAILWQNAGCSAQILLVGKDFEWRGLGDGRLMKRIFRGGNCRHCNRRKTQLAEFTNPLRLRIWRFLLPLFRSGQTRSRTLFPGRRWFAPAASIFQGKLACRQ